jgi:hypothetical protein
MVAPYITPYILTILIVFYTIKRNEEKTLIDKSRDGQELEGRTTVMFMSILMFAIVHYIIVSFYSLLW